MRVIILLKIDMTIDFEKKHSDRLVIVARSKAI